MKKLFTLIFFAFGNMSMAQTACDSLDIDVKYAPFNDSFLQVHVYNQSQEFFGYPIFTVYNSNGDTVAVETLNFFGIGQESLHTLNVKPGMLPLSWFNGTLTLYYQTVDSYAVCSWPIPFSLCPNTCATVYPYLSNIGGAQVFGTAEWEILDSNLQVAASGTFTMDTTTQYATDSACLLPGDYTLKVKNIDLTAGGQKYVGLNPAVQGMMVPFNNADSVEMPYQFFEACYTSTSVKETKKGIATNIHSFENSIYINSPDALGNIAVYSMDGREVYSSNTQKTTHAINLSNFSSGIYIVRVSNKSGTTVRKVYIE